MAGRHERHAPDDPEDAPDVEGWALFVRNRGVLDLPDPVFDRWLRGLRRTTGAAVTALCLQEMSTRIVKSFGARQGPHGVVELAPSRSLESYLLDLAGRNGTAARYAEAPVRLAGRVVGRVAAVAGPHPHAWGPGDDETLCDTAAAVSTRLALRLVKSENERVRQQISAHHQVDGMIARAAPLPDVLAAICEAVERYDPTLVPSVLLLDSASKTLHSGVGPSLPPEYLAATDGLVIGPNIGTCGAAAWYGELVVTPDLPADPRWAPALELTSRLGLMHCWSMPIKDAGGEVLGTLACYGRRPREPLPEHLALLHDWSRVAGIAIERSLSLHRLTYDARHDTLTGLPNRQAIFEELDEAIQRAGPESAAAVLFVDLDGLKALNDTFGHDRADQMIREMALRLTGAVRDGDFVGRFGGDEFIVIAERLADAAEAEALGAGLLEAVARPLPGPDATVVTASIGVALVRSDAVEAREVIRRSDAAMYEAKRTGRDRCVFSEAGHVQVGRRLRLARMLRGAETRGELSLVYQPVVCLPSRRIVGVEALLRWANPTFGQVPPSEFVPIAEDTGSIVTIGAWVLRESCEAMARLAELGHVLELGVNVSACQLSHPDFPLWVRQTLAHAAFPAGRLGLEITEAALVGRNPHTADSLRELESLGVRLVLDDFGTGYSSLSWLKQHPFAAVKIDDSFVHGLPDDPADRAIVRGVIDIAGALGCSVTAEGVETETQLASLEELGCRRAQGFLLLEPVSADCLHELLGEPVIPVDLLGTTGSGP